MKQPYKLADILLVILFCVACAGTIAAFIGPDLFR
jgi:hypothetical protein